MNYILKDHLGSIQYVTDEQGNVVETLSFDPWGRRRNPVNWSYTGFPSSFLFDRGYTGHEHLDAFGLINMNGRMYDPVVSRFLSPDPFTQAPHNLQGLNRYSYLMNNPMNGTDPTGYMRKPNRGGGGGSITGGGPVFDYFEFVPSIFDQIDESVKRRSVKYSALSYEELQRMRDKENEDKSKSSKEDANSKTNDNMFTYNPTGMPFNLHLKGGMMNDGIQMDKEAGGGIIYKEGTYSFSDFNLQFLLAEGKGLLGGWSRVRGSAKVYRGKDGVYYVNVSAEGFTPSGTQGSVTFSGNVEVYSGGNLVGTQSLNKLKGASIIQSGWQNVGQGTFALPSYGSDVYLRFNIGYTYSEGAGYVSPWPAQGHSKLYIPYFVIDAWTY